MEMFPTVKTEILIFFTLVLKVLPLLSLNLEATAIANQVHYAASVDTIDLKRRDVFNSLKSEVMRASADKGKALHGSLKIDFNALCDTTKSTYSLAVYHGQEVHLPCQPCHASALPVRLMDLGWYRQSQYQAREMPISKDEFEDTTIMEDGTLVIHLATADNTGKYHCKDGSQYLSSYDVTVVENPHFHQVFISLGERPFFDEGLGGANKTHIYTLWSPWSNCNRCGETGERIRIGQCYINVPKSGYGKGLPCAAVAASQNLQKQYRRDEQLIEDCEASCSELGKGRNKVYSASNGMPTVPQIAERKTVYEEVGSGVAMICPRGGVGVPVLWEKDRDALTAKSLKLDSEERMRIDGTNTLHIHELEVADSALYSCWFENRLLATVRIVVTKPVVVDKGSKLYVLYVVLAGVAVFVGSVVAGVVRNRKLQIAK